MNSVQSVYRVAADLEKDLACIAQAASAELAGELPGLRGVVEDGGERMDEFARAATGLMLSALRRREIAPRHTDALRAEARELSLHGAPLETLLAVPAIARRAVMTAFEAAARADGPAVLAAERRLERLQASLTLAVTRGHLDSVQERWQEQHRVLESLMAIAGAVNRSLEVSEVAQAGLSETLLALGLDAGALWLAGEPGEKLELASTVGFGWEQDRSLWGGSGVLSWLVDQAAAASFPIAVRGRPGRCLPKGFDCAVGMAVRSRGVDLDAVAVLLSRAPRELTAPESTLLAAVADLLAVALDRAQQHRREARTDHLTGLANRPEFERAIQRAVAVARRHGRPLTLMMMDLDDLKLVNDRRGHHAGDDAIRAVADTLRKVVRVSDTCARLGGDEFALLMPDAGLAQGQEVSRRVRDALERLPVAEGDSPLRLSIGLARWEPGLDGQGLFRLADGRLYEDKRRRQGVRRRAVGEAS